MKKYLILLWLSCIQLVSSAQSNWFPSVGNAGVGTTDPSSAFEINRSSGSVHLSVKRGNELAAVIGSGTSFTGNYGYMALYHLSQTVPAIQLFANDVGAHSWVSNGTNSGNFGIGTTTPTEKLSVNGKIRAQEIKVETANWPDYVFDKDYELPTLAETERFVRSNKHLPGMPSAAEVMESGVSLGLISEKLLKKIEELTLHLIEADHVTKSLVTKVNQLETELSALKKAAR